MSDQTTQVQKHEDFSRLSGEKSNGGADRLREHALDLLNARSSRDIYMPIRPEETYDFNHNKAHETHPTDADRATASDRLKQHNNPLLSPEHQESVSRMQEAILKGDKRALAELVQKYKDDPATLKRIAEELNRTLNEARAGVSVLAKDGTFVMYGGEGEKRSEGYAINSKTGETSVVRVKEPGMFDRNQEVTIGDPLDKNPDQALARLSEYAVVDINFHASWRPVREIDPRLDSLKNRAL